MLMIKRPGRICRNLAETAASNLFVELAGEQEMEHFTRQGNDVVALQPATKSRFVSHRSAIFLAAGAALAASALIVRQRTRAVEAAHPPAGKFMEVEGVRLHYVERGQGQPLVLLHGDGSLIQDFETSGLIDIAAKNYRVIAFDRPGYGYSGRPRRTIWTPQAQARLLHHALQRLQVEQPVVVGHSWGTLVAVALGLEFPADVKSLVLLSGYYYPTARLDIPLVSPPAIPIIGDLLRYTVSPLLGRLLWPAMQRRIFRPAPVPHRFRDAFPVWMVLRPPHLRTAAAEAALAIPGVFALRHRYRELAVPVMIMAGGGDRLVDTRKQSERLHRELPHSMLHVISGAGHMLHHLSQHAVMEAIHRAAHVPGAVIDATGPAETKDANAAG
jgi:pimeloyl-ACP methyl ester carboxylesterase